METREDIVRMLAEHRKVEEMVQNIAHKAMDADLSDLSQMVYLILLEYDERKIVELWEADQIGFFIARIIINQFRSSHSPFYATYMKSKQWADISTIEDIEDEKG